jgi:lipopolysaccharide export system protein LptC
MSVAPLHRGPATFSHRTEGRRVTPNISGLARRRHFVTWTKRLLPAVAVLLLATIVLWPEISRQLNNSSRFKSRHGVNGEFQAGKLVNVRYRGVDGSGRPYTVTADQAQQDGPERINLVNPKGDLTSVNGSWTLVQSIAGVYIQHAGLLDLSGDVTIFRDNGVTLRTPSASMDLKSGAAAGNEKTHSEGPFGTLDAQGFALVDKGAVIQFQGASRLLLNGSHR